MNARDITNIIVTSGLVFSVATLGIGVLVVEALGHEPSATVGNVLAAGVGALATLVTTATGNNRDSGGGKSPSVNAGAG